MGESPPVLLLCRDLMFVGKVTATARAVGRTVRVIRDPGQLPAEGGRLMVDLSQKGALEAAAVWREASGGTVIGFAPHVDTETIARAREAGFEQVLTRGRFTAEVASLIQ